VTGTVGAVTAAAGGAIAGASGWGTPEGLSAFVVALTGFGALCWSIYSAKQHKKGLDAEQAREIAKAIREELGRDAE
jgi:hypothetical protein